jgi:hypothetical protein
VLYGCFFGIFIDLLARHKLSWSIQAQCQLDEVGFSVQYLNQRERWNFGGAAQRIPMVYGRYGLNRDSQGNIEQRLQRIRYFDTSLQGYAQYPFSQVQRVEFSAGVRRIAQDVKEQILVLDPTGSFLISEPREETFEGMSLNLLESSAALVYDSSLTGYTSPFAGQRYRFQVTPTFGELQFVQGLADYRRYEFWNPFTLAVRGMHIGRYGRDSERQDVFYDLYLGDPWYIRGYSNTYSECTQGEQINTNDCEVLSNLFGSRIGLVNTEIRFPLIRQLVIGTSLGLPPIEGFLFGDAGIAWNSGTTPTAVRGVPADASERGILTSAGAGARVNLFGILILEVDYVNAFQRDRGWHWQFGFVPGF